MTYEIRGVMALRDVYEVVKAHDQSGMLDEVVFVGNHKTCKAWICEQEVRRLAYTLFVPEVVDEWMHSPVHHFQSATPLVMIAAGRGDEVLQLLHALLEGAYL